MENADEVEWYRYCCLEAAECPGNRFKNRTGLLNGHERNTSRNDAQEARCGDGWTRAGADCRTLGIRGYSGPGPIDLGHIHRHRVWLCGNWWRYSRHRTDRLGRRSWLQPREWLSLHRHSREQLLVHSPRDGHLGGWLRDPSRQRFRPDTELPDELLRLGAGRRCDEVPGGPLDGGVLEHDHGELLAVGG